MINKFHFDVDGFCFKADLPFAPSDGDYILIEGTHKETGEKKCISLKVVGEALVYNCINGEWQLRWDIHERHQQGGMINADTRDPMGDES
jgi:hypothetical protein